MKRMGVLKKYGFVWVTLALFLVSLAAHWGFGWYAYVDEQRAHQQSVEVSQFLVQIGRDTFENWQSEFLQLIWQVVGLAMLLYIGSSQSKEGEEREEAKMDWIMRRLDPEGAEKMLRELHEKWPKK